MTGITAGNEGCLSCSPAHLTGHIRCQVATGVAAPDIDWFIPSNQLTDRRRDAAGTRRDAAFCSNSEANFSFFSPLPLSFIYLLIYWGFGWGTRPLWVFSHASCFSFRLDVAPNGCSGSRSVWITCADMIHSPAIDASDPCSPLFKVSYPGIVVLRARWRVTSWVVGKGKVSCPVWTGSAGVVRKAHWSYCCILVWITLTRGPLMWKETWRLCRGWVTWIGLPLSPGWLCGICGGLASFRFLSEFVPLFHPMFRTLALCVCGCVCDLTVTYGVWSSVAVSQVGREIHPI